MEPFEYTMNRRPAIKLLLKAAFPQARHEGISLSNQKGTLEDYEVAELKAPRASNIKIDEL